MTYVVIIHDAHPEGGVIGVHGPYPDEPAAHGERELLERRYAIQPEHEGREIESEVRELEQTLETEQ